MTSYGDTQTNLHFAAWSCDREVVEMHILQGKDVTAPDSCGWTALHLAVWNMHTDMVIFLPEVVDPRSWVSAQNQDGITPLHLATSNNDVEVIKTLFNAGANNSLRDNDGQTAMHLAAQNGHV
jgi:ankyrin repeat protein